MAAAVMVLFSGYSCLSCDLFSSLNRPGLQVVNARAVLQMAPL